METPRSGAGEIVLLETRLLDKEALSPCRLFGKGVAVENRRCQRRFIGNQ